MIDVRPIRDMAGEELFNEIFFTDVRIPAKWRLGDEGEVVQRPRSPAAPR